MSSTNINKFLKNLKLDSGTTSSTSSVYSSGEWSNKLLFIAFSIFAILIILVLIHYLVTPIFKTKMGSKGIIPLPTTPEGTFLWDEKAPDFLKTDKTPIHAIASNYTISMDVYIEKPNDITNLYRTLLVRQVSSNKDLSEANPDNIGQQIGDYNLAIYLEKGTNKLYISCMSVEKAIKTITIKNAPVREAFRLVVVLSDNYMDAYMNGHLVGSVTFSHNPLSGANYIFSPSMSSVKVKRVKVFDRALEPAEAKDIRPGLATFVPTGDIPDSTTCSNFPTSIVKKIT